MPSSKTPKVDMPDFLRDCGYRVVEAASTDEAIVILQNTNAPFVSID